MDLRLNPGRSRDRLVSFPVRRGCGRGFLRCGRFGSGGGARVADGAVRGKENISRRFTRPIGRRSACSTEADIAGLTWIPARRRGKRPGMLRRPGGVVRRRTAQAATLASAKQGFSPRATEAAKATESHRAMIGLDCLRAMACAVISGALCAKRDGLDCLRAMACAVPSEARGRFGRLGGSRWLWLPRWPSVRNLASLMPTSPPVRYDAGPHRRAGGAYPVASRGAARVSQSDLRYQPRSSMQAAGRSAP